MFKDDQRKVAEIASASREGLFWVLMLAIASARQPFWQMQRVLREVKEHGASAPSLLSHKRGGYLYPRQPGMLSRLQRCISVSLSSHESELALMLELLLVPGLGLIKAGFVMQLTTGKAGCFDGHNQKRFPVGAHIHYQKSWTMENKRKRAREYLELCSEAGGSEMLWDSWCELIAERHPTKFKSPDAVSAWHWRALPVGTHMRGDQDERA